jgi:hypothetical protein
MCIRLEMSLRTNERAAPAAAVSLAEIAVGSVVEGRVRRVEDFGVFVEVTATACTFGIYAVGTLKVDCSRALVSAAVASCCRDQSLEESRS